MARVTVTIDRILELSDKPGTPRYRVLSFQSGPAKQFAVHVPGHPTIEPGMTVTALLDDPKDWQTLRGWKNLETGEVAVHDVRSIGVRTLLSAGVALVALCLALDPDEPARSFAGFMAAGFAFVTVLGCVAFVRQRRVVRILKEIEPHAAP